MSPTATHNTGSLSGVAWADGKDPNLVGSVVFIDPSVPEIGSLLEGVRADHLAVVLDGNADGLKQIAETLAANGLSALSAIHIVAHGTAGQIQLGATLLYERGLKSHAALLSEIGASLAPGGDILLYACDVARGDAGRKFVEELSIYTGANVAAASHPVGAAARGASWVLDVSTGLTAASAPFSTQTIADYQGVLVAPTLTAMAAPVDTTPEDTQVEITFAEIAAQGDEADSDGTVVAFVIQAVTSGLLLIGTSPGTATPFAAGTNDTIDATNNAYWTPALDANGSLGAFTVVAKDDANELSATPVQVDVSVTAVNDEPTLTATGANPTFAEGAAGVALFTGTAVSTVEAGQTITSLTLTVSNVTDGANEILFFDGSDVALTNGNTVVGTATNGLTVNVTVAAGVATVTFSGATLSATAVQTLVDAITYRNTSQDPTDANRVVTITQIVDSGPNGGANNDDNVSSPGVARR